MDDEKHLTVWTVVTDIHTLLDGWYQCAEEVIQDHWDYIKAAEKRNGGRSPARLAPRCRRVKHYIQLEWYRVRWLGSSRAGTLCRSTQYVTKPKGSPNYTVTKLIGIAQDWEAPIVKETEETLAEIRAEVSYLIRALPFLMKSPFMVGWEDD